MHRPQTALASPDAHDSASSSSSVPLSELKCVNTLSGHHSGIRAIAVHGGRVFTGSYDNTIKVWSLDSGLCEATLEGHLAWIRSLLAHRHEPMLFSGSDDGLIKVWRIGSSADECKLQTSLLGHCIQPAYEAPPPATGDAAVCIGATSNREGDGAESLVPSRPCSAAPSRTQNRPQSATKGASGSVGILSLALDYERNWLLGGSQGAIIFVWALPAYSLLLKLQGHRSAVKQLVVTGDMLLTGSYDRTIKIWSLANRGQALGSFGTRGSVWALCVHNGLVIAAVGDSSIKVWRLADWEMIATLSGHRGLVLALAVHEDLLFSGSDDRSVRVWRMGSWRCERVLTGHNGGVVGLRIVNGCLISASNDSFIKVWSSGGVQRPFTAIAGGRAR